MKYYNSRETTPPTEKAGNMDQIIIEMFNDDNLDESVMFPKEVIVRETELKTKSFAEADTWTELYAMIISQGGVDKPGKSYTAREIIGLIDSVRKGEENIETITRHGGLRAKVSELLDQR